MRKRTDRRGASGRGRLVAGVLLALALLTGAVLPAQANITLGEYIALRQGAAAGNKAAEARWRFYVIGLMDGLQAVQAPAMAAGGRLHFCMPDTLAISPRFLDQFIQDAVRRAEADGTLERRAREPMAVLVAVELKRAYPCD